MFEMQSVQLHHSANYVIPVEQANALCSEGFTPREIVQLMAARSQSVRGKLDDNIREYTRFRFALWLYQRSQSSQIKG